MCANKVLINASYLRSLSNFRGHLISTLSNNGYNVCCTAPDDCVKTDLQKLDIELITTHLKRNSLNPFGDLGYMFNLVDIVSKMEPRAVLNYTIKPVIFGSLAARFAGVKSIYSIITGLGYAFMNNTAKQRFTGLFAKMLYRVALKYNTRVFFQNPDDMQEFLKYRIVTEAQCVLVNGSGVDLQRFSFHPVKTDKLRFLLVARLLKEKGIIEFLEAASLIKNTNPDIEFDLVGPEDPSPSGLKIADIRSWVEKKIVNYHGSTDNVVPFMQNTSVYVLPSYREGTPRTVLEAMATGRPIITTDAPGCRETVVDGLNGFIVPPKNHKVIATAMQKFIDNPALIMQMGLASRKLAEKKYDVHEVNRVILTNMGLL